jgi:hypothetical protein
VDLTIQEEEFAALAVERATNAEGAAQLAFSERTANSALHHWVSKARRDIPQQTRRGCCSPCFASKRMCIDALAYCSHTPQKGLLNGGIRSRGKAVVSRAPSAARIASRAGSWRAWHRRARCFVPEVRREAVSAGHNRDRGYRAAG